MHSTASDEGRTSPMYKRALMFNKNIAHFIGSTTVYVTERKTEFGRYRDGYMLYNVHHAVNYLQFLFCMFLHHVLIHKQLDELKT